ncbi:molybdopterin molybdotransferase MoeA [Microbacterium sediminicola]|uniref:Molybdopterin molybdenumtransferase n=1 Tax=Microbacterium sediminicola TaxID=415210 RepID=A0ABP4TFV7_9MICO
MSFARTVDEHREAALAAITPLAPVELPVAAALGRTTATAVRARVDIPAFDNSAMDGYALRAVDGDMPRTVVADIAAGASGGAVLVEGEAARIMTGAPLPAGADAIVPHERTAETFREVGVGSTVHLASVPEAGAHVRRRADDVAAGDVVLEAGVRLGPRQRAAVAAAGAASVLVRPAPRVVVISSGDELVAPGQPIGPGQIPESNGILLDGAIREADGEVLATEIVDDTPAHLRALLERIETDGAADLVILTGGASVGAYEVVRDVLEPTGVEFLPVAMQPGKPQGFGALASGIPVFCLPGNPVSVAVSFEVFVRPVLLRLQGRSDVTRPVLQLPAAVGWRTPPEREQYMPVAVDRSDPARWTVRPATAGGSGSHRAGALAHAEGWARVPAEKDRVDPGELVDVMLVP